MATGKGSQFERDFCRDLSSWYTKGERNDIFWRTAGSGGMATNRRRAGNAASNQEGDISSTDPIGQPFISRVILELKKGYNKILDFQGVLDSTGAKVGTLVSWMIKLEKERRLVNKAFTLLIIRRDRRKILIGLDYRLWNLMADVIEKNARTGSFIDIRAKGLHYVFMEWELFKKVVDPDVFMERINLWQN